MRRCKPCVAGTVGAGAEARAPDTVPPRVDSAAPSSSSLDFAGAGASVVPPAEGCTVGSVVDCPAAALSAEPAPLEVPTNAEALRTVTVAAPTLYVPELRATLARAAAPAPGARPPSTPSTRATPALSPRPVSGAAGVGGGASGGGGSGGGGGGSGGGGGGSGGSHGVVGRSTADARLAPRRDDDLQNHRGKGGSPPRSRKRSPVRPRPRSRSPPSRPRPPLEAGEVAEPAPGGDRGVARGKPQVFRTDSRGRMVCTVYEKSGGCRFGSRCWFDHAKR